MEGQEKEAALGRLRDFIDCERSEASRTKEAKSEIDLDSLARARDLSDLYDDRSWVKDLPLLKGKGRKKRLKPDSQERFAQWLKLKEVPMSRQRVSQLLEALVIAESCNLVARFTERALRPIFGWTGRKGKGSATDIPGLIERAKKLAGDGRITNGHVNQAIDELRRERQKAMGPISTEGQRITKAEAMRDRIDSEIAELLALGTPEAVGMATAVVRKWGLKLQQEAAQRQVQVA